jgi:hypothetical protein
MGDICFNIINQYSITMEQLRFWNTQVNEQCTNLIPGDAYCVSGAQQPHSKA